MGRLGRRIHTRILVNGIKVRSVGDYPCKMIMDRPQEEFSDINTIKRDIGMTGESYLSDLKENHVQYIFTRCRNKGGLIRVTRVLDVRIVGDLVTHTMSVVYPQGSAQVYKNTDDMKFTYRIED